jgi:hypothetical protein
MNLKVLINGLGLAAAKYVKDCLVVITLTIIINGSSLLYMIFSLFFHNPVNNFQTRRTGNKDDIYNVCSSIPEQVPLHMLIQYPS